MWLGIRIEDRNTHLSSLMGLLVYVFLFPSVNSGLGGKVFNFCNVQRICLGFTTIPVWVALLLILAAEKCWNPWNYLCRISNNEQGMKNEQRKQPLELLSSSNSPFQFPSCSPLLALLPGWCCLFITASQVHVCPLTHAHKHTGPGMYHQREDTIPQMLVIVGNDGKSLANSFTLQPGTNKRIY